MDKLMKKAERLKGVKMVEEKGAKMVAGKGAKRWCVKLVEARSRSAHRMRRVVGAKRCEGNGAKLVEARSRTAHRDEGGRRRME